MQVPPMRFVEVQSDNNYSQIEFLGDAEAANQQAGGSAGWVENERAWSAKFTQVLREMGYGGVRVHIGDHRDVEILVFDPSTVQVIGRLEA